MAEFTNAIRLNPRDAHAYSEPGLAHWRWAMGDGKSAAALRDFDEAIRLQTENCRFFYYRGKIRRNFCASRALGRTSTRLSASAPAILAITTNAPSCQASRSARRSHPDLEMYLDRDRTHGYRDHHEEQHPQTLLRDLKKKR